MIALLTRNLTTESYRVMQEVILLSAYQNDEKFHIKFSFIFLQKFLLFAQNRTSGSIIICFIWTLKASFNCNSSMNKIIFFMTIAWFLTWTTDTRWRHKSKISEKLGRCGRQNKLRPYLKIWDWDWIFGRAVKVCSWWFLTSIILDR